MPYKMQTRGKWGQLSSYFRKVDSSRNLYSDLERYGRMGVAALAANTPVDTGLTAASWDFEIERSGDTTSIHWFNTNTNGAENIAILLQYGHGTGTGGFVQGRDYINPAAQPVFDQITVMLWQSMTRA